MNILYTLLMVAQFILLARVLLSWFPNVDRSNPIIKGLYDVTEPVLRPIRSALPQGTPFDFSPLIVFVIINVLMAVIR